MDIEEAKEYIKMIIRKQEIPDSAKALGYVYATEAIETVLSELEKKDKIINEMATTLSSVCTGIEVIRKQFEENYCEFMNSDEDCCWKADKECSDCIKEYFTNKAENVGE